MIVPQTQNPAWQRGSEEEKKVTRQRNTTTEPGQKSTGPRRCPWFLDVLQLAGAPIAPYDAWVNTALIFAGANAWDAAKPTRESGRRAVTALPPGGDPSRIIWPRVQNWIGDCGDIDAPTALELARCLIDAGAALVHVIGQNIKPSLTMRRASRAN